MTEPGDSGDAWGGRKAMEVLALAFVFPLTIFVGWAAGGWIGERLGDRDAWALGGAVVGAVAGFLELWAYLRRLGTR
jgi:positive regulator of sigma E activity